MFLVVILINVDFDRGGTHAKLLSDFMSDLNLLACDLSIHSSIEFTYERDDGLSRSWIDHIICSRSSSSLVTDVYTTRSGCILLIIFHYVFFFI